jgi:hypothetical protein
MPIAARERGITIDQLDGFNATAFGDSTEVDEPHADDQRSTGLGVALSLTRTAVLVALAALAILVLLPAVLAAQVVSPL